MNTCLAILMNHQTASEDQSRDLDTFMTKVLAPSSNLNDHPYHFSIVSYLGDKSIAACKLQEGELFSVVIKEYDDGFGRLQACFAY